jgi:hypothetical protein
MPKVILELDDTSAFVVGITPEALNDVGASFNPGNVPAVDRLKLAMAAFLSVLEGLPAADIRTGFDKIEAWQQARGACMWAVRVATAPEADQPPETQRAV